VSDSTLLSRGLNHRVTLGEEDPQHTSPHCASVPGIWRWSAGSVPGNPREQAVRCRTATQSGPYLSSLAKEGRYSGGIGRRVPAASIEEAREQLPGELGIVAILAKVESSGAPLSRPAGTKPAIHVFPSGLRRLSFDHESQRIPQSLP
jgi:hypothetical protein